MKIKILKSFSIKLANQVDYIAKDKPIAARKFKQDVLKALKSLEDFPFRNKKSIYFTDTNIRDLTFKGYTIVYRVKPNRDEIAVFGFLKYSEKL